MEARTWLCLATGVYIDSSACLSLVHDRETNGPLQLLSWSIVKQVGKYTLLRELGRGGMGTVYLAEDGRLRRQVALKLLIPSLAADRSFISRFEREAQIVASLNHPGIVRINAFDEVEGSQFIDMEYVAGGSLDAVIARGPCPVDRALPLVARVLDALACCHAAGVVHRDIKPTNILLAEDGAPLLTDFGLASSLVLSSTAVSTSSCFIGTPKYAPPELWQNAEATPASDVYAVGLVLLEMLSGRSPYDGMSALVILREMSERNAIDIDRYLPDASPGLKQLLAAMLDHAPLRRPKDAGEALERLQAVPDVDVSGATSRTMPLPRITPRSVAESGKRLKRMVIAIAVALVGIGVLWQLPQRASTRAPNREHPVDVATQSPPADAIVAVNVRDIHAANQQLLFSGTIRERDALWALDPEQSHVEPLFPLATGACRVTNVYPYEEGVAGRVELGDQQAALFFLSKGGATTLVDELVLDGPTRLVLLGTDRERIYYNRIDTVTGYGLWASDGTRVATRAFWREDEAAMITGFAISASGTLFVASRDAGTLFRRFPDSEFFERVWPPDEMVAPQIEEIHVLGEMLLIEAGHRGSGMELWCLRPEASEPALVYDFMPGAPSGLSTPRFASVEGGVVFAATTPEYGREPWFTDGTKEGTRLIHDVNPGALGSDPYRFTSASGGVFFSARNDARGAELRYSGPGFGGAVTVDDPSGTGHLTDPYALCPFDDGILFTSHCGVRGEELWYTEGTSDSTRMVFDFLPGADGGEPHGTAAFGDRAIFSANHPEQGRMLWETDGTPEGTRPLQIATVGVASGPSGESPWVRFKGRVVYRHWTHESGGELWISETDGSSPRLVMDLRRGTGDSDPADFFVIGGWLYFTAFTDTVGRELWRTQGTPDSTTLVADLFPGPKSSHPRQLTNYMDTLVLVATVEDGNVGLFRHRLDDLQILPVPGTTRAASNGPFDLQVDESGWLYFSTMSASGSTAIWRTDGETTEPLPVFARGS